MLFLIDRKEQRGCHRAVIDIDTGRGDAHGVDARQVRGSRAQRGHNAVIVILRVAVGLREPHDLLVIDALAVDDGRDLAVAAAGVKADAAALGVAADGLGRVLRRGQDIHRDDLEGVLIDVGHKVKVKLTLAALAVDILQIAVQLLVALDIDAKAALHPQQRLDKPLDVVVVGLAQRLGAVDEGVHRGHLAAAALHSDADGLFRVSEKAPLKAQKGDKPRIKLGTVFEWAVNAKKLHDGPSSCGIGICIQSEPLLTAQQLVLL